MATPTIRQVIGATGTTNSTSVTTTSATAVGDTIVAINQTAFRAGSTGIAAAPAGTTPVAGSTTVVNGWRPVASVASVSGAQVAMAAWAVRVTTAGAKTITTAPGGSAGNTNSLIVYVIPGAEATASPIDGTPSTASGGASTAQSVPQIDPGSTDSLLIGSWGAYGVADYTSAPSGMSMTSGTAGYETNLSGNNAHMAASQALASGSPTGAKAPGGGNSGATDPSWAGLLFAVRAPLVVTKTQRFYLTNTAAPVVPNTSGAAWNDSTLQASPYRLGTAPAGTSTSVSRTETSTDPVFDVLLGQWVSGPLSTGGAITGTMNYTVADQESSADANLRPFAVGWVRAPDGSVRGTLMSVLYGSPAELPTTPTAQLRSFAVTQVSAQAGDRVVFEVGYRADNTVNTPYTGTVWYGGTGTPDLANGDTITTRPAWFEITVPNDVTFLPDVPIVSAGADVPGHTVGTVFNRTATELTNGGATITARAWTIQSGPAGVGSTIGTAAALAWTPSTPGSYVLRYTATNSAGGGLDDVAIVVTGAPVTAAVGAGQVGVQGAPVTTHFVVGVRPDVGTVGVQGVSVHVAHVLQTSSPAEIEVEGLPIQVSRHVNVTVGQVAVGGELIKAAGTGINPGDIAVQGLPVQVSYVTSSTAGLGGVVAVPPQSTTRFIAQSILDGRFLHWDLPLSGPQITLALSGPTVISGTFDPEDPDTRDLLISGLLASGLEPWGCWIHVETDGEIRASGILRPYQIDGERLSIEATGVSSYLQGLPYLGELSAIAVDPADVVRSIWAHVQSYPDGKLGVTVTGSTPVRIGEPEPEEGVEYAEGERPAGPYKLSWWEGPDCGSEVDNLAQQTPFDYVERCAWNADKTDVVHWIEIAHPRVGARRDARFATGENVISLVPVEESDDLYASQVIVFGKGEGRDTVTGYAGRPLNRRLRRVAILQDSTVPTQDRANALAGNDIERRQGLIDVTDVEADARHDNAKFGSYGVGDDVLVDVDVAWLGRLRQYERVLSITYAPDGESVRLQLRRADAFRYGGTA